MRNKHDTNNQWPTNAQRKRFVYISTRQWCHHWYGSAGTSYCWWKHQCHPRRHLMGWPIASGGPTASQVRGVGSGRRGDLIRSDIDKPGWQTGAGGIGWWWYFRLEPPLSTCRQHHHDGLHHPGQERSVLHYSVGRVVHFLLKPAITPPLYMKGGSHGGCGIEKRGVGRGQWP